MVYGWAAIKLSSQGMQCYEKIQKALNSDCQSIAGIRCQHQILRLRMIITFEIVILI